MHDEAVRASGAQVDLGLAGVELARPEPALDLLRVGSASAAKTAFRCSGARRTRLTIWLSVGQEQYGAHVTSYGALMRVPAMLRLYVATVLARLPIGIDGIALVLFLRAEGASFVVAGAAAGGLALGAALGAPVAARLIDRAGVGVLLVLSWMRGA